MRISDWSSDVCSSDLWRIDRRAVVPCIAAIARIRLELGVVLEVEIVELRLLRHVSNQAVESGAAKQRALRAFQYFQRRHVERVRVKLHLGTTRIREWNVAEQRTSRGIGAPPDRKRPRLNPSHSCATSSPPYP